MKIALCFLISGKHEINKELLWKDWIEENKDIINVYFHYTDHSKIESKWIKNNCIPSKYIVKTDYLHVVPAYMSLLKYAMVVDPTNEWFCFLTESCAPVVCPSIFRQKFFTHYSQSIMRWKPSWWNVQSQKRANLRFLQKEYHLANTPWFILNKYHAQICIKYMNVNSKIYNLICSGDVGNESVFAIIFKADRTLDNVLNEETTVTDWDRMMSSTSPYLFRESTDHNTQFVEKYMDENKNAMFIRKIDKTFPDETLLDFAKRQELTCSRPYMILDLINVSRTKQLKILEYVSYLDLYVTRIIKKMNYSSLLNWFSLIMIAGFVYKFIY